MSAQHAQRGPTRLGGSPYARCVRRANSELAWGTQPKPSAPHAPLDPTQQEGQLCVLAAPPVHPTAALAAQSPPCAKPVALAPTPLGHRRHARSVSRASSQQQPALLTQAHAPPASLAPTPPPTEQQCARAVPPGPSTGTLVGPVPLFAHHVPQAPTRRGRHPFARIARQGLSPLAVCLYAPCVLLASTLPLYVQ